MSTIYGNPLLIGGGGVKLNIDYGTNPPSDTTKLWVPRATAPSSVEAKYEFKFGNEQLSVSDTNFIPHTSTDTGNMRGIPVGNYIYIFKSSSSYSGFQRYDMTKNEWDTSFSSAVYPKNALNYVSTVAIDDKIYCLGGYSSGAQSYVYEYDIAQNTFTAKTNSPINLSAGCWIKYGDVLYGFGTYYGSYNRVVKYDYTTNTFTDVSSEFSFGSSQTTYGSNVYYYPFDAGNGIYYLLPTYYNTVTVSSTDLIKVDMANKSVTKDISLSTLCPTINYPLPTSGTTLYKDFCFAEAGIVQVGSTGYIIGGRAANNRDVPFIWKVNISSGGLTATVLDKYLFDPTKSINLAQRRAAACLNNEIHIVQYCYSGSDTTYRNNQTLTLYSPLDNNKLFLQTGFGNNKFNIVNDNKAKVEIAINNAFIGNSENKADEIDAFLCDTNDSKWKNIKTGNDFYALKGDLIYMDLDGNGDKQYRVLKINGSKAMVLGMSDISTSQAYNTTSKTGTFNNGTTGQLYAGSDLNTYLNTTWYNTLTAAAKAAIVPESRTQYMYQYYDQPDTPNIPTFTYQYQYNWSDSDYENANLTDSISIGNRNVFALDLKDIFDYFGKVCITSNELMELWTNQTSAVEGKYWWLSSADAETPGRAWDVSGGSGRLDGRGVVDAIAVRPAFTIDLSKIPFARV